MDELLKESVRVQFIKFLGLTKRGALNESAKAIGCNRTHLSLWRDGKKPMSDHLIHALAYHLSKNGFTVEGVSPAPGTTNTMVALDPTERLSVALRNASLMVMDTTPLDDKLDALEHTLRYITDKLIPEMRSKSDIQVASIEKD